MYSVTLISEKMDFINPVGLVDFPLKENDVVAIFFDSCKNEVQVVTAQ
jgi:hypothetical protein